MIRINITSGEFYLDEPTGKQDKMWILNHGIKYLYKKASLKSDGNLVYNDLSECIAMDVAKLIKIPVAQYFLCSRGKEKGVISPDFLKNDLKKVKKKELIDGVTLINRIDPNFKNMSLFNPRIHQFYTVSLILESLHAYGLLKEGVEMLVYDALIANRDRNPSNYGIIINHETNLVKMAPLYDNCASLGISMANNRLNKCIDEFGNIIDEEYLNLVIHKHIIHKVTLERFLQYKEKRTWDINESKRINNLIEDKRKELLPLVETGQITWARYHKELYKIGNSYNKFDISTVTYQPLINYLINYYPDEMEEVVNNIKENITLENIEKIFRYYEKELPLNRTEMAKNILLRRADWIVNNYEIIYNENRGKLLR